MDLEETITRAIDPDAWNPGNYDPTDADGVPFSETNRRLSLAAARRVVQGLGLREERRVCMECQMTLCDCGRPRETRLVTDWQEDTPHD